jgi:hypothetical protein
VKDAKLKQQDVELAVSAEFIRLEDIADSVVDNHTRTRREFKCKAPVLFCKVDYENLCAHMSQRDCNASMRALHIADALARNLAEIWQKSPENLPRLSNDFTRFRLWATKGRQ